VANADDLGAALTGLSIEDMFKYLKAADIKPKEPEGTDIRFPELSVESQGPGRPRIGAELNTPALGGEVGLRGSYQKVDDLTPPEIAAMIQYRRKF